MPRPKKPDNERKKNQTFRLAPDTLAKLEWLAMSFHDGNETIALEKAITEEYERGSQIAFGFRKTT